MPQLSVRVDHQPTLQLPWEVFRGHLLDQSQTRSTRLFEAWSVQLEPALMGESDPLLCVLIDWESKRLYVVRSILVHGHEAYEDDDRTIKTREVRKGQRELVGSLPLDESLDEAGFRRLLNVTLKRAVLGTSRLPITSIESPLPAFSLGKFAYLGEETPESDDALTGSEALLDWGLSVNLSTWERAKRLETLLRCTSVEGVSWLAVQFFDRTAAAGWRPDELPKVIRSLFNGVALSPMTGFSENLVALLCSWTRCDALGPAPVIELVGYLLRHLVRHLTAFNLEIFHHLGANYPDAPLLDSLLGAYVRLINAHPDEFADRAGDDESRQKLKRLRRRALRQAWYVRREYQGLPVPDEPSSPGENLRVLPQPWQRIPEEQFLYRDERSRELFVDVAAEELLSEFGWHLLRSSVRDLRDRVELRELGTGLFLDRPLGVFKRPAEIDRTVLLSYVTFSRTIAKERLDRLSEWGLIPMDRELEELKVMLEDSYFERGVSVADYPNESRPGVVCLEDASKAAPDVRFLKTTRSSLDDFLGQYDLSALDEVDHAIAERLRTDDHILLIRPPNASPDVALLRAYDREGNCLMEFGVARRADGEVALTEVAGIEYIEGGLVARCPHRTAEGASEATPEPVLAVNFV
ncbi:hypothetical protein [Planctomycetes bacterium Pan216]